jgi:nitrogen regulatory protein PII
LTGSYRLPHGINAAIKKDEGVIDIDSLLYVIVNRGKANAILKKAQELGAVGGTIFLGEGTVQSRLLETIGLTETHKEILMISSSRDLNDQLHEMLSKEFSFSKRNQGIAFSIPFQQWQLKTKQNKDITPRELNPSHYCIMTIVDKGRSRECIKAARASGAKGGTLIHGRGAGIPTDFYFPLVIEPQKEILLIVSTKDKVPSIRNRIFSDLELGKPGNGILFTLPVIQTTGLYENRAEEGKGAGL